VLDVGPGGVEAHPIRVGVEIDGRQVDAMSSNQVEVVIDARVDQPRAGPVVASLVPPVDQIEQAGYGPHEVEPDPQQPVRRPSQRA
jgi:hypothetical protein